MTPEDLQAVLDRGDAEACLALFEKATEKERKAVAKLALECAKARRFAPWVNQRVFEIAVLASASLGQLKKRRWSLLSNEEVIAVLVARRPPWLDDWAQWKCDSDPYQPHWSAVRRLERLGICKHPQTDNYTHGMVAALAYGHGSVYDALCADPELLENEVWRIFQVGASFPYPGPNGWYAALGRLADEGRIPRQRLLDASLDAIESDFREDRGRGFLRFHEFLSPTIQERSERVQRYLGLLHSRNASTVTFALGALRELARKKRLEVGPLLDNLAPALLARGKGIVKLALQLLDQAGRSSAASTSRVALMAAEALAHPAPDIEKRAIDLIERHGNPADLDLRANLGERLDHVAPSQRSRLQTWLAASSPQVATPSRAELEPEIEGLMRRAEALDSRLADLAGVQAAIEAVRRGGDTIPSLMFEGTEMPRLNPDAAIKPIQNLDELIDLFAAVLENPAAPDDIERVLDGVARLCTQQPADFAARTGPLLARANDLAIRPFYAYALQGLLCDLVLAWVTGKQFCKQPLADSVSGLFNRRINDLIRQVGVPRAGILLSTPTHSGGWIDPLVLAHRVQLYLSEVANPHESDGALAILRLAPDNRSAALAALGEIPGEFASALRYALGSEQETIATTASWWVSAARARALFADDLSLESRHPGLGPDAGLAARYTVRRGPHKVDSNWGSGLILIDRLPPIPVARAVEASTVLLPTSFGYCAVNSCAARAVEPITVLLHRVRREWDEAQLPWAATLWPLGREAFFAAGAEEVAGHTGVPTLARANRAFLLPLFDPDVPFKPMALHLLALALSAKQPDESGLATDVLIAAIEDGRVGGEELGAVMRSLEPSGLVKPLRWAKALGEVARVSHLHSRVVATILQGILQDDACQVHRDRNALLELLKELLIAGGEGVSRSATREYLSRMQMGGRTGALSAELLEMQPAADCSAKHAAALRALSERIERAERWMHWQMGRSVPNERSRGVGKYQDHERG